MLERIPLATWEHPGTRVFEYLFMLTAPLAAFMVVSAVLGSFIASSSYANTPLDALYLLALATLYPLTWWFIRSYRKSHPGFLATPIGCTAGEVTPGIAGWVLGAYLAFAVIVGAAALAWVDRTDHHWQLLVLGLTGYVPAFLALPVGTLVAWRRLLSEDRAPGNNQMQA
jgi:hypothetical protein